MKRISSRAKEADVIWEFVRDGARHELWRCGDQSVSIPRHNDINELTAERIMKDLEEELGGTWWR